MRFHLPTLLLKKQLEARSEGSSTVFNLGRLGRSPSLENEINLHVMGAATFVRGGPVARQLGRQVCCVRLDASLSMSESKRPRKRPRKQESLNNDTPPNSHSSASTLRAATPTAVSVNAEVERATNLVELDELSGQKPPKHDDEFWFEDGTIILITDNVAFRVYEGLLSRDVLQKLRLAKSSC